MTLAKLSTTAIAIAILATVLSLPATAGQVQAQQSDLPPPPDNFATILNSPAGQALLSWDHVPDAQEYRVWYGTTDGSTADISAPVRYPSDSLEISDLIPGAEYAFHIMAKLPSENPARHRWTTWSPPAALTLPTPSSEASTTQAGPAQDRPAQRTASNPNPDYVPICGRSKFVAARISSAVAPGMNCRYVTDADFRAITELDLSQSPTITHFADGRPPAVQWDIRHREFTGPIRLTDQDLDGLEAITNLDISGLAIPSITPDFFTQFPNLITLKMSRNRIHTLPANLFRHAPNLTFIDLSYNRIQRVDAAAFNGLPDLGFVSLSYNQIDTLPAEAVTTSRHPQLHYVGLLGNPGSDSTLGELPVRAQSNIHGHTPTVCLTTNNGSRC